MREYCTVDINPTQTILSNCTNLNSKYFNYPTANPTESPPVKRKLVELLRQPSISDLNERLNKLLNTTKYETSLNETLGQNINNYINDYYVNFITANSKLNQNLVEKKVYLNSLIFKQTSSNLKARSNEYKCVWFDNQIKFEEALNLKQKTEINKLEGLLADRLDNVNNLNQTFKTKLAEIENLKQNFNDLNSNYNNLNENLFDVKNENSNLKDYISNLRKQIEFYKNLNKNSNSDDLATSLNLSLDSNLGSMCSSSDTYLQNDQFSFSSNTSYLSKSTNSYHQLSSTSATNIVSPTNGTNLFSMNSSTRLDQCKQKTVLTSSTSSLDSNIQLSLSDSYSTQQSNVTPTSDTDFYKRELADICNEIRNEYEIYMQIQLDDYEDEYEQDFFKQLDEYEAEYEEECKKNDHEYDELSNELDQLNDEFLQNLSEFIELNELNTKLNERVGNLSENLLKFSKMNTNQCEVVMLKYSLNTLKKHVNESKIDVEKFELQLSTLKNILFNKNIDYILNENLLLKSIKSIIPMQQLRQLLSSNSNMLTHQQIFEVLYTQTCLFGYLQFNFNLNHKTSSISVIQNKIDTSMLIIENLDKVLDLDLSEWTLRREIYGALKVLNQKSPTYKHSNTTTCTAEHDQIEFKFPKGFKLKRRKKLILLSASANMSEYQALISTSASSIQSRKSSTSSTSNSKLSFIPTKSKDVDLYYCNSIANWGCGLQIVTKLINNKNMTKYVNYRSFKSIWSNLV